MKTDYASVLSAALKFVPQPLHGPGRRSLYTVHLRGYKSHRWKPVDYVKPYGVRTKGYATHGNGGVK